MDFDAGSQQSVFDFIGIRKFPLHKRFDFDNSSKQSQLSP